jgi:hypothetical protein
LEVLKTIAKRVLGPTLAKKASKWASKSGKPREGVNCQLHVAAFATTSRPHPTCEFQRVFYEHEGRLVFKWGHYLEIYETFLMRWKDRNTRILELGVSHGGSLQLWRKYLGPAARIAGIDIDPQTNFSEPNTRVFLGSQDDQLTLHKAVEWLGGIDVVIDDGSHVVRHQNTSLDYLFPRLSDGGIYICEDLHTNYWGEYGGSYRRRDTFIERMKSAVDDLNHWHHQFGTGDRAIGGNAFGIHFYDSVIVIEKRVDKRPFNIQVGDENLSQD